MFTALILAFASGLVIGWNVIPQPKWVQTLYQRWFG